jgi:hypothetical protein
MQKGSQKGFLLRSGLEFNKHHVHQIQSIQRAPIPSFPMLVSGYISRGSDPANASFHINLAFAGSLPREI